MPEAAADYETAFKERFARYRKRKPLGETAERPRQKQAVSFTERIRLQNLASGPEQKADWLRGRGYEAQALASGQVAARKKGAAEWGVIDEQGGSFMDILDMGDEVAFGLLTAAGGASTAAAGPLGLLSAAGGAAVGGATAESVKKGLGAMAGFYDTPGDVLKDVAVSGAVGGVAETLLRGSGRAIKGLAGRFRGAPKAPALGAPKLEPPAPRVEPGGRPAVRADQLTREEVQAARKTIEEAGGVPFKPSAPPLEPAPVTPGLAPAPRPGVAPEALTPRTPTVRHTVTREKGGAQRETIEQVFRPAEKVEPHLSVEEAASLKPGAPVKVMGLVDPAPGEEVFITFLKKDGTVRTMKVHANARHPTWFSEAEVAQHADKMPITMLRELVTEHGPAPYIIKKTYGTGEPAKLEREALSKWLFEKQPGVVTGRLGPPGTRAAENRAKQRFQFWEQFSEYTPSVGKTTAKGKYQKSSLEKGEESILRNVIRGTKEYGGYRLGQEKNVLELRVGDRVYRFGKGGEPVQVSGGAAPAPKIEAAPPAPPPKIAAQPTPPEPKPTAAPPGPLKAAREKPELTPVQKAVKTGRKASRLVSLGRTLIRAAPSRLLLKGIGIALKAAKKYTPGAYATAGKAVEKSMASVSSILESRGREAAQAAAYALSQENKEFRQWLESQSAEEPATQGSKK